MNKSLPFPYNWGIDRWLPNIYPDHLNFYPNYNTQPPPGAEKAGGYDLDRNVINCARYASFYREFHHIRNYLDKIQKMDIHDRVCTLFAEGKDFYNIGKKVVALAKFDEVLELNPAHTEAQSLSNQIEQNSNFYQCFDPLFLLIIKRRKQRWEQRNLPFPYNIRIERWLPTCYPDYLNYFPNYDTKPESGQNLYTNYYNQYHEIKKYLHEMQPAVRAIQLAKEQEHLNAKYQELFNQYQSLQQAYYAEVKAHQEENAQLIKLKDEIIRICKILKEVGLIV